MKKLLLPLLGMIPLLSFAGGFQVNLQGTKQTGMGHLGSSFYLGASSTYFNPAMMGLDSNKFSIEAGVNFISSSVEYQSQKTGFSEMTDNPLGTPFYLYATYKISDKLSAGLGVYTPFGSTVDWGEDWTGKELIQDISLSAIFIQPTISYKISDKLRVGGGVNIVSGSVELNRNVRSSIGNENTVNLTGDAIAYGFNAAVYYEASDKLSFGLTYKSQVDVELEGGKADFTVNELGAASGVNDTKFDATLPLPSMATLGIAYRVNEKLLVSAEGSFVGWSAYESLDFDFEDNTPLVQDSENPRNYEDSYIFRVGGEYSINNMFDFRAGFYFDQSPVQDEFFSPETPNSDNLGITSGMSGHIGENFGFDLSILYIVGMERESYYPLENQQPFGGKYASRSVIAGVGLNYSF